MICENVESLPSISLNQSTFRPDLIQAQGVDPILRGLFAQSAEAIDLKVLDQLRNTLFGPPGSGGIDLAAVDIQRGRDVGLPDYNQARVDFGLAPVTSFAEITSDTDVQAVLEEVYGTVDDIDAIVGGLAEDAAAGSMVGEFFQKVIADQFARLRDGDRFWYENGQFTADELSLIRETSLSALLERNTEITGLADNLFSTGRNPGELTAGGTVAEQTVTEYASYDGSNNNLNNPTLGTPGTHLRVDYTQEYGDGIRTLAGEDRANVREISNQIFAQSESIPDETGATGYMLAWSQFMGHDLTFAPAGAADTLKIYGTEYESSTDELFPFVAEKLNLVLGHEVYAGVNNVIERPIYLPALDIANNVQTVDASGDITVTNDALGAQVFVEANSLTDNRGNPFTGQLSISEVAPEVTPAALPENLSPDLVVTIQPGEMVFDTPARLTLPNTTGLEAGTQMDLWSINPTTGDFEIVGVGRVSADGEQIETIDGGIRNSSWHFFSDRPLDWLLRRLHPDCEVCVAREGLTSEVELYSGALVETHDLPGYQSLGETRGVQLVYDSLRADARPILEAALENPARRGTFLDSQLVMTADLSIDIDGFEYQVPGFSDQELSPSGLPLVGATNKHFWRLPSEGDGPIRGKLQADLSSVETGIYNYSMTAGIQAIVPRSRTRRVTNPDGSVSIITTTFDRLTGTVGGPTNGDNELVHVNSVDSDFGSGWGIAGVQRIVEGYNGSVLLIDGDGSERVFKAPREEGGAYKSPVGNFSTLKKLDNGVFQLTNKDKTIYTFDDENRLISVVDANNRETRHIYENGKLRKIIDPVGLETLFSYGDHGKVDTITDPANRITQLVYSADGNLIRIIDPDDSGRTFEYDQSHRMTAEIDKKGAREEVTYNFAGRVTGATRKDGSVLEVNPVETQGLYRPEATATRTTQAVAGETPDSFVSRYVDGNGNVKLTTLDGAGQVIVATDEIGQVQDQTQRNEDNRVERTVDARGFATNYRYDEYGNVISTSNSLSGAGILRQDLYDLSEANYDIEDVELRDLNNDGELDIIAAHSDGFTVLLNQGDRTFQTPEAYIPENSLDSFINRVLVEDVNLDGILDITTSYVNGITVFVGDGTGQFLEQVDSDIVLPSRGRVSFSDLDSDGKVDLLFGLDWFKGDGHGGFESNAVRIGEGDTLTKMPYGFAAIGDFDNDGDFDAVDVVDAGSGPGAAFTLQIYTNIGDGEFWTSEGEIYTACSYSASNRVTSFDIDEDEDLDLVIVSPSGIENVLLNNGNGVFDLSETPNAFSTDIDYYSIDPSYTNFLLGEESALGDLDGDGDIDVIDEGSGFISVLLNEGDDRWNLLPVSYFGDIDSLQLIDFDQNGSLDMLTKKENGVGIYLNNGNGVFEQELIYLPENFQVSGFSVIDVDRDNHYDLLLRGYDALTPSNFLVALGDGEGNFTEVGRSQLSAEYVGDFAAGFVDRNSSVDLVSVASELGTFSNNKIGIGFDIRALLSPQQVATGERVFTYDETFQRLTSVTDELSQTTIFDIDPATGNRLSATRVVGELDQDSGEMDDVTTTFTYTGSGLTDTVTDALGRVTDYDYDGLGRVSQVTYAQGTDDEAIERFAYDSAGNLTHFTDANGHVTAYDYDALNRVIRIIEADPDGVSGPLAAPETAFAYDAAGNISRLTDARGHVTQYVYDERDRLTLITDANNQTTQFTYDGAGNLVTVVDALNRTTQHRYDQRNRRIETIDPAGYSTQFEYDLDNNLTAVVDAVGNRTAYTYDARNRMTSTTDALGGVTQYAYDAVDRLVSEIDQRGFRTDFAYDELNRLVGTTNAAGGLVSYAYDKASNVIAQTDERDHTTAFDYDARNRLSQVTDALGGNVSYTYDGVGNQLTMTDQLNRTTVYAYDALNRLSHITDALNHTTAYGYDTVGNMTSLTDALARTTSYRYDALNRQIEMTDAAGGVSSTRYDAVGNVTAYTDELGRTTTYDYDQRNLLTQVIDPLTQVTTNTYNEVGNLVSVTDALGKVTGYDYDALYRRTGVTDALGQETRMAYDAQGNLLSLTDASGNVTDYTYDSLSRMVAERITVSGEVLERRYDYDLASNLTERQDRNGRTQAFTYDKLNRQTQERWLDAQGNTVRDIDYSYDAASQLTSVTDPDSAYSYTYDAAGRLLSTDNSGTAGTPDVLLNYGYDAVNNRTSVADVITGQQAGLETFAYDDLNRVTRIEQSGVGVADKRVELTYNAASQMTGVQRYRDLAGTQTVADSRYDYDTAGRLTALTHEQDGNSIAGYGFTYDAANRLTQLVTPDGTSDYSYNDRDELTGSEHSYQENEAYSYDDTGNRNSEGYDTGDHNRLAADGTYTYEYDGEGNRTRRVEIATGEVTEYGWDHRNRMTSVVTKDANGVVTKSVEYTYDLYDRRIAKSVDSDGNGAQVATEERYLYDGEHIALVFDGEGNQLSRYLHGPQVDQVLAEETAEGEVRWALSDHQGTVRDLIDGDGTVLNHITYDSYGQVTSETNPDVDFRFGYTGRERDQETGLYYYRARYFDPAPGTFVSTDPLGFNAGDSNIYRYVFNGPTNFTDPSGLIAADFAREVARSPIGRGLLRALAPVVAPLVAPLATVTASVGAAALVLWPSRTADATLPTSYDDGDIEGDNRVRAGLPAQAPIDIGYNPDFDPNAANDIPQSSLADDIWNLPGFQEAYRNEPLGGICIAPHHIGDLILDGFGGGLQDLANLFPPFFDYDYSPTQKHRPGGWGTEMDLDDATAGQVLDNGMFGPNGNQRYGYHNGRLYEFQPDNVGGFHGYPIRGNEAPPEVLRELRDNGTITKSEYNKFVKGKK